MMPHLNFLFLPDMGPSEGWIPPEKDVAYHLCYATFLLWKPKTKLKILSTACLPLF